MHQTETRWTAAAQILINLNRLFKRLLEEQENPILGKDELKMIVALTELELPDLEDNKSGA